MGFAYKSINTKTPSMSAYSGNVVEFNYQDTKVDNVELLNAVSTEVENLNVDNVTTPENMLIDGLDLDNEVSHMTGCVIATGSLSLVEGLLSFGEDMIDFGVIISTVLRTPKAYLADKVAGFFGKETHFTESMWEDTRSYVSKEHVKSAFDGFYDNTKFGQYLKENTPGFDTVRAVGNTVGYSAGVIGTAAFTGGVSPASMAAFAGMAGTAKHTSEAWNDGASTGKGLIYGAAAGGWDAVQWYAGGKIAQFGGLGEAAGSSFLHSPMLERFARIGMDSVDGGLEGIVQPALSLIYKDYGQDNIINNYKAAFGEAGGWKYVGEQTLVAGGLSILGESMDGRKILGDSEATSTPSIDTPKYVQELAFFEGSSNKKKFISNLFEKDKPPIKKELTQFETNILTDINNQMNNSGTAFISLDDTSKITSNLLDNVSDLSKLKVRIFGGFNDLNGNYRSKYNNSKYLDRITYSGYEALAITRKLDYLTSKVDMNLPIPERARQIYEILANEIPVMYDFEGVADGHKVSASLRGLTSQNSVGKEGLVCAGYSQAYKELCSRCGITCDYIRGIGYGDVLRSGKPGGHAWNIVVIDQNNYIPVDVTWHACGGPENWFGGSYDFESRHVADADEWFKDYSAPKSVFEVVNDALNIHDSKYGSGIGFRALQEYLDTGNINLITSTDGARDIIRNTPDYILREFVNAKTKEYNAKYIVEMMMNKYGARNGLMGVDNYLKTLDNTKITRSGGARDLLDSVDAETLKNAYLDALFGI